MAGSSTDFSLSSLEVMRGVKVKDGCLRLRPGGWMAIGTMYEFAIFIVVGATAWFAGGPWRVVATGLLVVAGVDSAAGLRLRVVASDTSIEVRNRYRTRTVAVADVMDVRAEIETLSLRRRRSVVVRERHWLVGSIITRTGQRHRIDALIGAQRARVLDGAPPPVETKVEVLRRWTFVHARSADARSRRRPPPLA